MRFGLKKYPTDHRHGSVATLRGTSRSGKGLASKILRSRDGIARCAERVRCTIGFGGSEVSVQELRERLEAVVGVAREQLRGARELWDEVSAEDLRIRLGGAVVGGLLVGRVVRRLAR